MSKTKWVLDPAHSEIQFKIKHLMISTVTGQFNKFEGMVETEDEDFTRAKAHITADIHSISTNNEQRDAHLRSGDFFDADNHPQLVFETEKIEKTDDELYKIHGLLTMRGVSKQIVLEAEYGGITKDPWGNRRVGFSLTGKVNRKDFGVSFGMLTETGGIALGEEVKMLVNAQFVKQAVAELV
ncbi:MAG: YceI family protein [Bacteroidota bacterium]|nr:YceI family protein [Bacteroidota bacterium]MDP4251641.1 YceI family protein [Bacteroidota bacterium]